MISARTPVRRRPSGRVQDGSTMRVESAGKLDVRDPGSGEPMGAARPDARPVIVARDVTLTFEADDGPVYALSDIDLTVREGEFVSFIGPSGCGKTTLLRVIADLE